MRLLNAFLIVLTLSSCGKDYVCECKASIGTVETSQIHGTHSKAKKKCDEKSGNIIGQSGNVTIPVTCYLK